MPERFVTPAPPPRATPRWRRLLCATEIQPGRVWVSVGLRSYRGPEAEAVHADRVDHTHRQQLHPRDHGHPGGEGGDHPVLRLGVRLPPERRHDGRNRRRKVGALSVWFSVWLLSRRS